MPNVGESIEGANIFLWMRKGITFSISFWKTKVFNINNISLKPGEKQ